MVSASLGTLALFFGLVMAICSIAIMWRAFQQSVWWGMFFLLSPLIYYALGLVLGPLVSGLIMLGGQLYFLIKYWVVIRRYVVYELISWVGLIATLVAMVGVKKALVPPVIQAAENVQQAGDLVDLSGEAFAEVPGGRIWYKRAGTGAGTPLVLLHGGPGLNSYYLKPLEALGDERPVIRYDQLGSGRSDRVSDTTLYTISRFVQELDSLRAALGVDRMHLLGHSWGAVVAVEYYRAHPARVASLTFASPSLSSSEWMRHSRTLVATLSDSARAAIAAREVNRDFDAPDYLAAVDEYASKYISLHPNETDRDSTMRGMSREIYNHMWGPNEFTIVGTLRNYDATRFLRSIKVPALYTVGQFDEAGPDVVKKFAAATPGAKFQVIPDAAHLTTWDNPDETLRIVREFLRGVDATKP